MQDSKYSHRTISYMVRLPQLRRYRELAALSQDELAKKARLTRLTIINLEQGKTEPMPSTTRKLAKALGVKPAALMAEEA